VATLLHEAGRDPSLLVGGLSANFDGSFRDGAGPEFVVEGDEYDTAFFDKTPKFLHYHPDTLVVTSIEFDHADIYRDLAHVQGEFAKLVRGMSHGGVVIAAAGARTVDEVVAQAPCRVVRYGVEDGSEVEARGLDPAPAGTRFALHVAGAKACDALLPAHGAYNVMNALAAVAVLRARGVDPAQAAAGLVAYKGVKRRQEERGTVHGVTLVDDFAHHPTAVRETLAALRARYPGRRLVAVFEPRSNTSRRAVFQRDYARAFDAAAALVVQIVPDAPIYSATGEVTQKLSAAQLAADVAARGVPARAFETVDEIVAHLAREARPGDVVVTLSNGGFGGIWEKLLAALRAP
jgi:UDP-N-acetylmuramate: L-alanyl-gamma-D-glutamyl-meso-diaminopimelate ligase